MSEIIEKLLNNDDLQNISGGDAPINISWSVEYYERSDPTSTHKNHLLGYYPSPSIAEQVGKNWCNNNNNAFIKVFQNTH